MKKLILLAAIIAGNYCMAQNGDAQKYAELIQAAELQKHLAIIAADDMEGRETGTAGQCKAAAYIESFFSQTGLKKPANGKGYQQLYPLYQDSLQKAEFEINGKEAVFGTDYILSLSNNGEGKIKASQVVFVGYGIEDPQYSDYKTAEVKGKVVVFFLGEPKQDGKYFMGDNRGRGSAWTYPGLPKKLALAKSKGAVGAIVLSATTPGFSIRSVDAARKTNVYFPKAGSDATVNYVQVSQDFTKNILGAATEALIAKAKANTVFEPNDYATFPVKTELELKRKRETIMASNVLGLIEGTDKKDEYVFVTAHYDHIGTRNGIVNNGADDDGSGTVSIMQIAKAFAKARAEGKGPRRTVVIMAVSGEEKGLWGSEYYTDHPMYPLDKTTVDLNIDMIGRIDTERMKDDTLNYIYVVGHDKISSDLPIINEGANDRYTKLVFDYKFDDPKDPYRIYFRSDHYNFARKGVPVLFFYDGMLKSDYHKPTDDIEKINFPLMEKRAKMIFYTAWEMANRAEMLKRDIPLSTDTR